MCCAGRWAAGGETGRTVRRALCLVLLLVLSTCICVPATASATAATALSSHVLNLTLSGAGTGSNWPATSAELSAVTSAVNTTVCGAVPAGVDYCNAFLMRASAATLGLQLGVNTLNTSTGNATYYLLSQWVDSNSTAVAPMLASLSAACATVLGTTLTPLTFTGGVYTVPCRGALTYSYLPRCAAAEVPATTAYILAPSSDVRPYFSTILCGAAASAACSSAIVVQAPSGSSPYTVVTITGLSKALEAVLAYVADVRAGFVGAAQAIGPSVGSATAGVTAQEVQLRYGGMRAVLFSKQENNRTYSPTTRVTLECQASAGYWAFALIAILPLGAILLRYVWHRGRHRAKKQARRRIVEDETRIMQGYANAADARGVSTAPPPPGVDTSATGLSNAAPQWVMDENGNYYDANTAAAPADAGATQTYVDPNTGETYQYTVEDPNTTVATADARASQRQPRSATAGDSAAALQTYVDPNTGETYQYVAADAAAAESGAEQAVDEQDAGDAAADGYQTYVDPETGETYQYTTAQDAGDATAAADGYQTYVDPETGETYQYTTADGGAEAAQEDDAAADGGVYVDPNTGETYQYEAPQ
ncbi:hypothetical protein NESM_000586100 [Novymonas esmeraldas]|uniref:Uncharacterized protein n=1 Tax=Novymonas esmeraldas TaxID=1808958 RepID=A0AAW0ES65_9TRYP